MAKTYINRHYMILTSLFLHCGSKLFGGSNLDVQRRSYEDCVTYDQKWTFIVKKVNSYECSSHYTVALSYQT